MRERFVWVQYEIGVRAGLQAEPLPRDERWWTAYWEKWQRRRR